MALGFIATLGSRISSFGIIAGTKRWRSDITGVHTCNYIFAATLHELIVKASKAYTGSTRKIFFLVADEVQGPGNPPYTRSASTVTIAELAWHVSFLVNGCAPSQRQCLARQLGVRFLESGQSV